MNKFLEKYWGWIGLLAIISFQCNIKGYQEIFTAISILLSVLWFIQYIRYKKNR
jgi:hypothetical protein